MKSKPSKFLSLALALLLLLQLIPASALRVAAAQPDGLFLYPEYPKKIARDYLYEVSVSQGGNRYRLPVYNYERHANHYSGNGVNSEMERRFCEFSFSSGDVTVEITVHEDMTSYMVMPSEKSIASANTGNTVTFTIDEPGQYVFRINDDDYYNLAIFADAAETDVPNPSAENVIVFNEENPAPKSIQRRTNASVNSVTHAYTYVDGTTRYAEGTVLYFEAGWHDVTYLGLDSNQQVYLAPGAVLNSRIQVNADAENVKIFGRGMLRDGNDTRAYNSDGLFNYLLNIGYGWNPLCAAKNVEVRDIKLLDSKSFNVVFNAAKNCNLDNIKIISNEISTDGISYWGNSSEITVKNSYIYVCDNLFVIGSGGAVKDLLVENCVLGTSIALFFPQATLTGENMIFRNLSVFRANGMIYEVAGGYNGGTITIENMSLVDCVPPRGSTTPAGNFFGIRNTTAGNGKLKTVVMKNIALPTYPSGKVSVSTRRGTTDSSGNFTESTSAYGNCHVTITNLYTGTQPVTYDSDTGVGSDNILYYAVPENSTVGVKSTVKIVNDGTYTPPTANRTTVNVTVPKVYLRTSAKANNGIARTGLRVNAPIAAFEQNGTVYVDAAAIAEKFGFSADKNGTQLSLYDEHTLVRVTKDSHVLWVRGEELTMSAPALEKDGRIAVPYEFFEKAFARTATYTATEKTVVIQNLDRGENLLKNGDFESPYALESWTCFDFTPLTISDDAHSGSHAMLMRPGTNFSLSDVSTSWRGGYQPILPLVRQYGGGLYTVSFWAKCLDETIGENALITSDLTTGYGMVTGSAVTYALTDSWQQYTFTVRVADSTDGVNGGPDMKSSMRYYLNIAFKGASRVLIDDVTFVKTSHDTNYDYQKKTTTASTDTLAFGETATLTVAGVNGLTLSAAATNDAVAVGEFDGAATKTATLTVRMPSRYERTCTVYVRDLNSGRIVGEATFTIPADPTAPRYALDFTVQGQTREYYIGQAVDDTQTTLSVTYQDGTSAMVNSGWTTDYAFTEAGTSTVNYHLDGKTVPVNVTVKNVAVESLTLTAQPTKMTYAEGETFCADGMAVTARYADGTELPVVTYTVTAPASLTVGQRSVQIACGGAALTFKVNVSAEISSQETYPYATIRIGNGVNPGIRFCMTMPKDALYDAHYPTTDEGKTYEYSDSALLKFGTVLIPTAQLDEGKTVAQMFADGSDKVLNVPASVLTSQDAQAVYYTAVLTDIPAARDGYLKEVQACAYVCWRTDTASPWQYRFGESLAASYYQTALAMTSGEYSASRTTPPDADERAIMEDLHRIVDLVEAPTWLGGNLWY